MQLAPNPPDIRLICEQAILPQKRGLAVEGAVIDIRGATISGVYRQGEEPPPIPEQTRCETIPNSLVAPAFVDAHTHLALTCLRGLSHSEAADNNLVESFFYKIEAHMTWEDVRAFVRVGGLEAIMSGTGVVWDHYYFPTAIAAGLRDIGLPGVVAPTLQDRSGPGMSSLESNIAATVTLAESTSQDADGVFSALGLHAGDTVSSSLLARAAVMAEQYNLPVHCHIAQSLAELERVNQLDGCSPGQHIIRSGLLDAAPHTLLVHGIFLTDGEVQALARKDVTLALCPHSKQIFAYLPDIERWMHHDVRWIVGTDCAASNDGWSLPRELRYVAGMRAAPTTWSAAHQAYLETGGTKLAAAAWESRRIHRERLAPLGNDAYILSKGWELPGAMHPAFRSGSISVGARANLTMWDSGSPCFWPHHNPLRALVWGETHSALQRIMLNGVWWGDNEHIGTAIPASDLWKDCRQEASERLRKLLERAG